MSAGISLSTTGTETVQRVMDAIRDENKDGLAKLFAERVAFCYESSVGGIKVMVSANGKDKVITAIMRHYYPAVKDTRGSRPKFETPVREVQQHCSRTRHSSSRRGASLAQIDPSLARRTAVAHNYSVQDANGNYSASYTISNRSTVICQATDCFTLQRSNDGYFRVTKIHLKHS